MQLDSPYLHATVFSTGNIFSFLRIVLKPSAHPKIASFPSPHLTSFDHQRHLARITELEPLNAALLAASRAASAEHAAATSALQSTIDQQTVSLATVEKQRNESMLALEAAQQQLTALQTQMALDRVAAEQSTAALRAALTEKLSAETSAEIRILRERLALQREAADAAMAELQTQVALDRVAAENAWAAERKSAADADAAVRTQMALDRVAFEVKTLPYD
jgi:hypothetical protein